MSYSSYNLLIFLFLIALAVASAGKKMAHIHFYMHGQVSGPNATSIRVVEGPKSIPNQSRLKFGDIYVYDDLLTEGPSPYSAPVGRGQAFYPVADLTKPVFLIIMNVVMTAGEYNGSSIAVLGGDDIFATVRELSVIGGTGQFRMARGYVIWKTYSFNTTSGDAVLELDIYATKTKVY
ncbi:hypothetical protein LUZ60_014193 [Juncus effusus]|nr:hypothetical protein LUZ60_014193 [Juncus effusus]